MFSSLFDLFQFSYYAPELYGAEMEKCQQPSSETADHINHNHHQKVLTPKKKNKLANCCTVS